LTAEQVPVSVIVPTIGRVELLKRCLGSLSECSPRPAEILVVDQSGDGAVSQAVATFARAGARTVPCDGRGTSQARNVGLLHASSDIVLFTDDDCTADRTWVGAAWESMRGATRGVPGMVTGRVLPHGDRERIPSVKEDLRPHDYSGGADIGALFSNNMAVERSAVLAVGGFDERFESVAEDVDLCFRWLRSGHGLRYEPSLVVWHHDWRTDAQLETLYRAYWRGTGMFFAKHLHRPEPVVLRLFALSLFRVLRGTVRRIVKGRSRARSSPRGLGREFVGGLVGSWHVFDD
jgi:GT2 family glycosyltransferase